MRIGTPLNSNATRVMLLGAGELGKEVIIALQRLGVETIAVDRYAHAPGQQVAHRAHVIDMTDPRALLAVIEKECPHLVVPEIEAIATDALAEVEANGLAEVIPTARATRLTMNREGIRRLAAVELGLPTSRYAYAESEQELHQTVTSSFAYPCLVKPVMSSSGKGQSLVTGPDEIADAWRHAASGGRVDHGKVIVEEMIDFDFEITLLTVRSVDRRGKGANGIRTDYCAPVGHRQVQGDYVESWQPQPMSARALRRARHIAGKVTAALGGRGIFGVELFVKGDQVWFSEVSPRPHDTGMVTLVSQTLSEFDLHARAILGLPVRIDNPRAGASAVIYGQHASDHLAFENADWALQVPESDLRLFGKPESFVRRRMGVGLATAADIATARRRARQVARRVVPVIDRK